MRKFTFKALILISILCISGLSVNSQTTIDLSAVDNPYVLQDTLPKVPGGSILLLKPGMVYLDSVGYDFDKSIELRNSDSMAGQMPRIDCKNNFNMAENATVDSVIFSSN